MEGIGCSRWEEADYILSERRARAVAYPFLSGFCTVHAWASVGIQFPVFGSGSQVANVYAIGHMKGMTRAVSTASAASYITFEILDVTTGTLYTTSIKEVSCGGPYCDIVTDEAYNKGITLTLHGGRTYIAYVKVHGVASIFTFWPVTAQARSDWGPWPTDAFGESLRYTEITIDF